MTRKEIAEKAESLREEANREPAIGYSNYARVIKDYQRMLNDILVLIRDLASQPEG